MNKLELYELRKRIETGLWILLLIIGFIGVITKVVFWYKVVAYLLIIIGLYIDLSCIYFRKSPVLRGASHKSKIAIVGTFIVSLILFYLSYYILTIFR
jgi:hypothetical protein